LSDQSRLIQLVTNVVNASVLLRHLEVDPAGPEGLLVRFADDFADYFEMSLPHTFDRLGLMTRGRDEEFSGRLIEWLGETSGADAARTFEASVQRAGHRHTFVKAVFAAGRDPAPTYYFRRRFSGPEAMELLEAEGVPGPSLDLLRRVADTLEKQTAAFVGRRLVADGPDRIKVYLTQYLPDGPAAVTTRLLAAARLLGVREDHDRAVRATVQGLHEAGGATLFVSVEFAPEALPEMKLYYESVPAPAVLAICTALRILSDFEEKEELPTLLGVVNGLLGAERTDYFGIRVGSTPAEAALYYYRDSGDA